VSGAWRAVVTGDGSLSFAHPVHGELCHDAHGAFTQARLRYAAGCRLRARARAAGGGAVLRLLDLGTGVGWNLAAALAALAGTGARLQALTLELDTGLLARVAALPRAGNGFPERCHRAVRTALRAALVRPGEPVPMTLDGRDAGELRLLAGDARATLADVPRGPRFDAVFLDPFSPRLSPELFGAEFLAEVARRMAPEALLATYSAATGVRVALAAAGLGVARGPRVGGKAEGTLAGPHLVPGPGDADLARRLERRLRGGGEFPLGTGEAGVRIH
jgi:tRNA U34 5-methylaminomethyl-2-thiouridine-forming methyltransferase MnmC